MADNRSANGPKLELRPGGARMMDARANAEKPKEARGSIKRLFKYIGSSKKILFMMIFLKPRFSCSCNPLKIPHNFITKAEGAMREITQSQITPATVATPDGFLLTWVLILNHGCGSL